MKETEIKRKENHKHLLPHFDVLNRYIKGCLFSITVRQRYKRTTWLFFCLLCRENNLQIHRWFFLRTSRLLGWKLSSDHDRRERGGSKIEKESDSFIGVSFRKRGKEGREGDGASYTCASLTSDKRIFQPTRVYRVTFTKAQVSGGMAGGGGDLGLEDGKGGRMNRGEDEIELEERQKAREGSTWARFLLCHKVAVRTDFLLSTMHWQQRMLPVFSPLFVFVVCAEVRRLRFGGRVFAAQRGQFLCEFSPATVEPTLTRRSIPGGDRRPRSARARADWSQLLLPWQ